MLALTDSNRGYYWRTKRGQWVLVCEMRNNHLVNAIKGLEKRGKSYTKFHHVLIDEAQRRGLDIHLTVLPFTSC